MLTLAWQWVRGGAVGLVERLTRYLWRVKHDDDSVCAVLSNGRHSHDHGETWHAGGSLTDLMDCEAADE